MRKLLAILALAACTGWSATWYATSSTVNINAANLWVPTSTGSCTGSGTALTWGSQATGDVFNANGCTALAVNVDPGGVSVQVTLATDATNGGGYTYATATNITIHANITAGKTGVLSITGSTGGGTIQGNLTGGSTATSGAYAVNDAHTSVVVNYGSVSTPVTVSGGAGAGNSEIGLNCPNGVTGTINIYGTVTSGSVSGTNASAYGLGVGGFAAVAINIYGACVGSDVNVSAGCSNTSTTPVNLTGNMVFGKTGSAINGGFIFTPAATNYVLAPKDSSYSLGTINTHATEMPTNPGVANVTSGVNYGSFTGTKAGGVCVHPIM